ncbi:MAG: cobalamin-dependent protein [Armatimonadota bacterium]
MRDNLIKQFDHCLSQIDEKTATEYEKCSHQILGYVNQKLSENPKISDLIGNNPIEVMHTNHACHVDFMASAFRIKSASTFIDIIAWVYQSYSSRGFNTDYFIIELQAWIEAIKNYFDNASYESIVNTYECMMKHHNEFIKLSKMQSYKSEIDPEVEEYYRKYLEAILKPSSSEALKCTQGYIKSVEDVPFWWEKVIEPAMYEIGRKWADGEITVGQEHLATSITQRVMAAFYPLILQLPREKGNIVFTSSPGELHEIGPRMIADFLEIKGWNVYYTGADTPIDSILDMIEKYNPKFLCISTTLPFNLSNTEKLIKAVKKEYANNLHILVGGQAYSSDPYMWQKMGADGIAKNATETVEYLEKYS